MVYLILLGLSVITPLFAFYFSEQMAYHLHYKKLARSFARIAAWVISILSISGFFYISYLSFSEQL